MWEPPLWIERTGMAIIYLHGSGWHYGDKDMGTRPFFRHLATQGHVIFDLAYPLGPAADLVAAVDGIKRAVAAVKQHAADFQINPGRVVLMGASAGGHLALLAAYTAHNAHFQSDDLQDVDTSVRAVVSYYGVTDAEFYYRYSYGQFGDLWSDSIDGGTLGARFGLRLLELYARRKADMAAWLDTPHGRPLSPARMLGDFLGGTPDDHPEIYRLASPVMHVGPHCPPTLLLNGGHDIVMKPTMGRRLQRALAAAGVLALYIEIPDTDHGFDLFYPQLAPAFQAATYDVERFLALLI